MIFAITCFLSAACLAVPFHAGSCCVESTTVSMRTGLRPSYSTVTWLFASGRRPLIRFFSRTSACRLTSWWARSIGSGMSEGVSRHAKPNIMPWSPAPCSFALPSCFSFTPRAMSGDCLPMATETPQLLPSKPFRASS